MSRLLKVIVVEDNPELCTLYADCLNSDPNITTVKAHNLAEAVALCQKEPQVVILADLTLPDATGVQAMALRKEAPGATFIVITGDMNAADAAKDAGAEAVIVKGDPESIGSGLIRTVRNCVTAHEMKLLFAPGKAVIEKQGESLKTVKDKIGQLVKNQN